MDLLKPPPWLMNLLPQAARDFLDAGGWYLVLALLAVGVLLLIAAVFPRTGRLFARRREPDPDAGLRETLAEYPPPPGGPGPKRLLVEGVPARIRLVVIAPQGKAAKVDADKAEPLLG